MKAHVKWRFIQHLHTPHKQSIHKDATADYKDNSCKCTSQGMWYILRVTALHVHTLWEQSVPL